MDISQQHSSCILECDHPISERERRKVLAELQAIGVRAVLLPMGISLASMASCGLEDDEDDDG